VRQATAAAGLPLLGEPAPSWEMLKHTADPTARSYLIHGMAARGVHAITLILRYQDESDVSARRALLLALGEYEPRDIPDDQREKLTGRLLAEFRDDPGAGLHGAIDWLLRQKWGKAAELDRIVNELASAHQEGETPAEPGALA